MKKFYLYLSWILGLGLSLATILGLGYYVGAWPGFPPGADAYAHMSKVKYILSFWPHIWWNYQWALGMPHFLWYAPLPYFLATILVKLKITQIDSSMIALAIIGLVGISWGVYGSVATLTKKHLLAFLAVLLVLFSPVVWGDTIWGGYYPRTLGIGFFSLFIWSLLSLLQKIRKGEQKTKFLFILNIILLALTLQFHNISGLAGLAAGLFLILFCQGPSKIKLYLKLTLPALAISSYLYLPMLFSYTPSRFLGVVLENIPKITPSLFWSPAVFITKGGGSIFSWILPLVVILWLIIVLVKIFGYSENKAQLKFGFGLLVFSLLFFIYALWRNLGLPAKWYINGFSHTNALLFFTIISSIEIVVLFNALFWLEKKGKRLFDQFLRISLFSIFSLVIISFVAISFINQERSPQAEKAVEMDLIKVDEKEKQYRFGTVSYGESRWFNYLYDVPQERDGFSTGILIPDWRFWFEQVLWGKDEAKIKEHSQEQIKFQLDWFSIKWFTSPPETQTRFRDKDYLQIKVEKQIPNLKGLYYTELEYKYPSPILTATNTPSLLVIGSKEAYPALFRNLAPLNYNSSKLIPVRGKEYIDDYSLKELKQFSAVLLYEYKFKNTKKAWELLDKYVREGGGLILEISNTQSVSNLTDLPEPFPTTRLQTQDQKATWDFKVTQHPITEGIDFNLFSEPSYEGGPWKIRTAKEEDLRERSEAIVSIQDQPVVISRELGKGRMLFSGLNLPYHALSYANLEESKFLVQMIDWVTNSPTNLIQPTYQAEFINPEERKITIPDQVQGILFKEAYFKNWRAYQDKQKLKVYPAGPDLMYIPVGEQTVSTNLTIKYQRSLVERLSVWLSILSLFILIIYCFEGLLFKPFLGKFLTRVNLLKGIKLSWLKEEE